MGVFTAVASAVAAICSAVAAVTSMLINHRNRADSTRPEIVIGGWSRGPVGDGGQPREAVTFAALKNIGRGYALHVTVSPAPDAEDIPSHRMATTFAVVIGPGEEVPVPGEIGLRWSAVPVGEGGKAISLNVRIDCLDSRGVRHTTAYRIHVFEHATRRVSVLAQEVAPGVYLAARNVESPRRKRWRGS